MRKKRKTEQKSFNREMEKVFLRRKIRQRTDSKGYTRGVFSQKVFQQKILRKENRRRIMIASFFVEKKGFPN